MSTVAVIPVKQLENAKQRLSGVLNPGQRQSLFQAMFKDVLEAATTCDGIERVIVMTDDGQVAEIAAEFGAEVWPEPAARGLIPAVTAAGARLAAEGTDTMLFLPADIPLITVEELEVVLEGFGERALPAFMIVPAHDLGGSNCVLVAPPDCMEFGFGEDSFRRHLRLARARGIEASVARLPGIGLDVDVPDDLFELVREVVDRNLDTWTARLLRDTGLATSVTDSLKRIG